MDLTTPLTYVKGVGPARAAMLEAKGLVTVEDLLGYFPFRYEDRSNVKTIAQLAPGEMATVIADVRSAKASGFKRRSLGLFEARFTDASRAILVGKWFHGGYLANVLAEGIKLALFGKVEFDSYTGELTMLHPEFEILSGDDEDGEASLHTGRIVPIYEAVAKLTTRVLRVLTHRIFGELPPEEDELPEPIRRRLKYPDRWTAIREAHFPPPDSDLRLLNAFRSQSQQRLIFEEFFWLECGVALKRGKARTLPGIAFEIDDRIRERVKAMLPFKPTEAQKRVIKEIAGDMKEAHPMNRLLQGDVGSGKTIVAAEAAVIAIENGYQVALLAPTEILAAQHGFYFRQILSKLGYVTVLLTGSFTSREKAQLKKLAAEGLAHVVVGTHAILEKDVEFKRLGLAIIDEQHRFGVLQRLGLLQKGVHPDVLVMTATPIPRTLAMTLYGDLDVSVIDELPPGRKPILTKHYTADRVEQAYSFMKRQIEEGRQAYVVYPVIEESETQAMKAAQKMYEHLSREVFPDLSVGLLHGRLGGDEKEAVMQRFKDGRDPDPRLDHRHRGRRGCAECRRDGDRAGRALRPGPTAPVAGTRGPRRRPELLHPGDGKDERCGTRAHTNAGGIHRWLLHLGNGSASCAAPASSSGPSNPGCPPCAWPISCGMPTSWRWRAARPLISLRGRPRKRTSAGPWPTSAITGSAATAW